jgi:hypothetical protein
MCVFALHAGRDEHGEDVSGTGASAASTPAPTPGGPEPANPMSASAASGLSRATETGLLSEAASGTNLSAALGSAAGEDASPSRLRQGSAGSRSASGTAGVGGASGSAGDAAAAMLPGLSVEEAMAMRAKLNGLSADVLTLRGEREGLNRALAARDRELLVRCCARAGGGRVSSGRAVRALAGASWWWEAGRGDLSCVSRCSGKGRQVCSAAVCVRLMQLVQRPWCNPCPGAACLARWRIALLDGPRTPSSSASSLWVALSLISLLYPFFIARCAPSPSARLQNLRNRLQEVEAAASAQAEGLRKRGAGAAGAAAAADEEDERDVKTHGFPLWQLLLVAVVFFLLGRLSNSWV